jgi:hypothetical protein
VVRFASLPVTGADSDLREAGHGETNTAADAECRKHQEQHR